MRTLAAALFGLLCSLGPALATPATLADVLDRAGDLRLQAAPMWLRLLHYKGEMSEILPGPFFIDDEGHRDPGRELEATLRGAFAPVEDAEDHALCRYPARIAYLSEALGWMPPPSPDCTELDAWQSGGRIRGASLILASGDLSNPASFFGHILLKFNEGEGFDPLSEGLFDRSLNFGAVVPENENMVLYMVRGLTGGYVSSYSHIDYIQHRHDYAENQMRDLWEYQLDLNPRQVRLLVDHAWELREAQTTYYFLTKNCAYEFAELLSLVLDAPLLPDGKIWSAPSDVFEELVQLRQPDGRVAVKDVRRIRSRQNRFRVRYDALERAERDALDTAIKAGLDGDLTGARDAIAALDPTGQDHVIETGLYYTSFARRRASRESEEAAAVAGLNRLLLEMRLQRPPGQAFCGLKDAGSPPHEGHRSALAQVRPVYNSALGAGVELRLRPVHSDFLSLDAGALPFSELALADVSLLYRDDVLSLRRADLIRITTLNVSPSGLPYDAARAWRFRVGAEHRDLACDDCLVGFVEGGLGASPVTADQTLAGAAMVEARLTSTDDVTIRGHAGPALRVVGRLSESAKFSFGAALDVPFADPDTLRYRVGGELRLGGAQTWDIRLSAEGLFTEESDATTEVGIAGSLFF